MAPMYRMPRVQASSAAVAPPPSPIPTAKGSRFSASSETFTKFLDNCVKIPELITLPPSRLHNVNPRCQVADVDFRGLSADSITSLLVSAKEFGVFCIVGHGVTAVEVSNVVEEAKSVFENGNRQSRGFVKITNDNFSNNMEKVVSKIEAIAEKVRQIFYKNPNVEYVDRSEEKYWEFRLFKHGHEQDHIMDQNHRSLHNELDCGSECDDHGVCIYLPLQKSQSYVQSERDRSTFDAGPEMLIVIIGKQLEGFECVSGGMICVPDKGRSQASFSLQLKVPFSTNFKRISIVDQVFFAVFIFLLYKFVVFLYTFIKTT